MSIETIHGLYDYHWWANRRLFDEAVRLGEDTAARDVGRQFSFPTVRRMLAHVYGADWLWLTRWKGGPPAKLPGEEISSLAVLRQRWDALEKDQRAFIEALGKADLGRTVEYQNTEGKTFRLGLGPLLCHVANHATHHRSEIATMITMISGSPPDTGIVTYQLLKSGQTTSR